MEMQHAEDTRLGRIERALIQRVKAFSHNVDQIDAWNIPASELVKQEVYSTLISAIIYVQCATTVSSLRKAVVRQILEEKIGIIRASTSEEKMLKGVRAMVLDQVLHMEINSEE